MTPYPTVLHLQQRPSLAGVSYRYIPNSGQEISGTLATDFSCLNISLDEIENDFVSSAATLVLAGLFIPNQIIIDWHSSASTGAAFQQLIQILYDVRAYCSQSDFYYPKTTSKGPLKQSSIEASPLLFTLDLGYNVDYLQLFSGGIDSTFSLLQLKNSGASPAALFLGINSDTAQLELEASRRIAGHLKVPLIECPFILEGLPERGADPNIWPQFGQFPYYNSIPHGRDILSAAIASIIASRCGVQKIAFGQEKESREKVVRYKGRDILRHDIESREGSSILNKWLNQCLYDPVTLISPIEKTSIEEIRLHMASEHPSELAMTQSCVWNRLCCRCLKCISLYILQRNIERQFFTFRENPLADPSNKDLANLVDTDVPDNEVGYGGQIRNGIRQILVESKYSDEDFWIIRASENRRFII